MGQTAQKTTPLNCVAPQAVRSRNQNVQGHRMNSTLGHELGMLWQRRPNVVGRRWAGWSFLQLTRR